MQKISMKNISTEAVMTNRLQACDTVPNINIIKWKFTIWKNRQTKYYWIEIAILNVRKDCTIKANINDSMFHECKWMQLCVGKLLTKITIKATQKLA